MIVSLSQDMCIFKVYLIQGQSEKWKMYNWCQISLEWSLYILETAIAFIHFTIVHLFGNYNTTNQHAHTEKSW